MSSIDLERKFELRDPVTPYVCSTPDFEDERDWLADHVFPKLAELCVARGTYFSPVDVRWSPQDSLAQEGLLLPSLLDLVHRSAPYFLCLLGERYGPYQKDQSSTSSFGFCQREPLSLSSSGSFHRGQTLSVGSGSFQKVQTWSVGSGSFQKTPTLAVGSHLKSPTIVVSSGSFKKGTTFQGQGSELFVKSPTLAVSAGSYQKGQTLAVGSGFYHKGQTSGSSSMLIGQGAEGIDWLELNLSSAAERGYSWVLQDGHQNCSFPELEIMAACLRGLSNQCTFYFRQAEHLDQKFPDMSYEERMERASKFMSESQHAGLKLNSLKQTIVKRGLPVRYFTTLEELGTIVMEDWVGILDTVCPPLYDQGRFLDTAHYQQWVSREALLTRLRHIFVTSTDTEKVLRKLSEFVLSVLDQPSQSQDSSHEQQDLPKSVADIFRQKPPPPPPYQTIALLSGDRGMGKSALLAQWLTEFEDENPGLFLLHHFIGAAPGDNDITSFLRRCTRSLRKHFLLTEVTGNADLDDSSSWWSEEDADTPCDFPALSQAFAAALALGPCVILLDGVNDLTPPPHTISQQEVKEFDWLPSTLPRHCRIILSTARADLTYRSLCRRGDVRVITLPALKEKSTKMSLLMRILRPHALAYVLKKQNNAQMQVTDMRFMMSPLALYVLGTELNVPSTYHDLEQFLDTHYETSALRVFWVYCLQLWVTQHSWTRDEETSVVSKDDGFFDYTGWVSDALCLLVVSRGGLLQGEVLQLLGRLGYVGGLGVSTLQWLRFRLRAGSLLYEAADGRIRFSHQHLQDMTEYTLLKSVSPNSNCELPHQNGKRKVHQQLASFFAKQPLSWRQAQELPWHLMHCGDLQGLLAYLVHSRVAHLFLACRSQYPDAQQDLQMYWKVLEEQQLHPGTHYMRILKDLGLYTLPAHLTLQEGNAELGTVESWLRTNPEIAITEDVSDTAAADATLAITHTDHTDTAGGAARNNNARTAPASRQSTTDAMASRSSHTSRDTPRARLSWGPHPAADLSRGSSSGQWEGTKLSTSLTADSAASSPRRTSRKSSGSPRREGLANTSTHRLSEESSEERVSARRPMSSPCSYRLSHQLVHKKEPSAKPRVLARRKVCSAPSKRPTSAGVQRRSGSPVRPQMASSSPQHWADSSRPPSQPVSALTKPGSRPLSATTTTTKPKFVTLLEQPEVEVRVQSAGAGPVSRPVSAPQPRQSQTSLAHRSPASSASYLGFLLTTEDISFSWPDLLDGMDPEERKQVLAELSSAVGWFLQRSGHLQAAFSVYSCLLAYLQASYPLSVSTQVLLVRVLERLGGMHEARGDRDRATENYYLALRITFDLSTLDEDLCDQRQLDTFKGVLLGHHGYQHLAEGDVLEAGELLKEATESIAHLTGNHALRASLLLHLGLYRGQLGELKRSEASFRQCLALRKQWHGQRHPEVAEVLLALARVLHTLNTQRHSDQRQEIEALFRKALAISEQCLGTTDLQVADILAELGEVVAEEDVRIFKMEARKLLQRSLDIRTTVLGADDASTKAARNSVRRVELSLQVGHNDAAWSHSDTPQRTSLMPQRDTRLPHMGSRGGHSSRTCVRGDTAGLDIRSVSREKVLLHNRPDSMMSSAMSMMTASERLLATRPMSSKGKASRLTSATSSAVGGRGVSTSLGWSAKSLPVEVRLDLDQEGAGEEGGSARRPGTITPREAATRNRRSVVLDLDLGEVVKADDGKRYHGTGGETDEADTPHLDSFAVHLQDGTILIGEEPARWKARKSAKVPPQSPPHRLFHHYATVAATGTAEKKPYGARSGRWEGQGHGQGQGQGRPTWSARTAASSVGSHVSRCSVPGPYDIVPGNTKSLNGPHSDISSLLGPPVCPRENVYPEVHHRSAFYHVPGRYPTSMHGYPSRRCQKTDGARILQTVLDAKMAHASRFHSQFRVLSPSSPAPRGIRVTQHDVSLLVRQTAAGKPQSRANVILASARHSDSGQDLPKSSAAPAVTFCEPISVS